MAKQTNNNSRWEITSLTKSQRGLVDLLSKNFGEAANSIKRSLLKAAYLKLVPDGGQSAPSWITRNENCRTARGTYDLTVLSALPDAPEKEKAEKPAKKAATKKAAAKKAPVKKAAFKEPKKAIKKTTKKVVVLPVTVADEVSAADPEMEPEEIDALFGDDADDDILAAA